MYRAAARQWLYVKFMPPEIRRDLTTQLLLWAGLLVVFAWGLVGLVALPIS